MREQITCRSGNRSSSSAIVGASSHGKEEIVRWEKTLNVLRAFAMSCILPVMQGPKCLVHAGNKGRDLLLAVAKVTTLDEMVEQRGS
ncbi:hypothetical protein VTO58DRAFT_109837 [Aureobasidium pullulans]